MNFDKYDEEVKRVNQDYKDSIDVLKNNTLLTYIGYSFYYPIVIVILNIFCKEIVDDVTSISLWVLFGTAIGFFLLKLIYYYKKQKKLKKLINELDMFINRCKVEKRCKYCSITDYDIEKPDVL